MPSDLTNSAKPIADQVATRGSNSSNANCLVSHGALAASRTAALAAGRSIGRSAEKQAAKKAMNTKPGTNAMPASPSRPKPAKISGKTGVFPRLGSASRCQFAGAPGVTAGCTRPSNPARMFSA